MKRYVVDDQEILVEFHAFKKFLWLAAGFEVRVGGAIFLPRDRIRMGVTLTEFEFESQQGRRYGVVRSVHLSQSIRRKARYEVVVDGEVIAEDTQWMRGWLLTNLATLIIGINAAVVLILTSLVLRVIYLIMAE